MEIQTVGCFCGSCHLEALWFLCNVKAQLHFLRGRGKKTKTKPQTSQEKRHKSYPCIYAPNVWTPASTEVGKQDSSGQNSFVRCSFHRLNTPKLPPLRGGINPARIQRQVTPFQTVLSTKSCHNTFPPGIQRHVQNEPCDPLPLGTRWGERYPTAPIPWGQTVTSLLLKPLIPLCQRFTFHPRGPQSTTGPVGTVLSLGAAESRS